MNPLVAGVAGALVLVIAAVAIIGLQGASDERRVHQLWLAELETTAAAQRQFELRAVALGAANAATQAAHDALARRVGVAASTVARASADSASLAGVVDRATAFRAAASAALDALAAGDVRRSARIEEGRVEPAYTALTALVDEAQADAGRRAEDAAALARAGTLAVLGLAAVLSLLIVLRLDRARRAAREAFFDPLTGLPNRMLFADRLAHALSMSGRDGRALAVLFVDLDEFKAVNDTLGHAAGDELLVVAGTRAVATARASDTVARLGGDEFAFLLEGTDEAGAARFAERFIEALRVPVALGGRTVTVDATIGCAIAGPDAQEPDDLLRNADLAMYAGKRQGKGCFVLYEPSMYQALADRIELEADLRGAVDRGEIAVVYQPIVEVESGRLTAVEALARWNHPSRGAISPAVFIPIAEESGVIRALGTFVLTTACTQARRWQDAGDDGPPLGVTVNVSPAQFLHGELVGDVRRALERSGLPPAQLTLEITESVLVERGDAFIEELEQLSALGVRLAIDDFGTGYSSLSSLARFPVDVLKIDRSFVSGVEHDEDGHALVKSIVDLGRTLGLVAVAEGVEDLGQAAALADAGCDLGQGFHFARPMDAGAIDALLAPDGRLVEPAPEPSGGTAAPPLRAPRPRAA